MAQRVREGNLPGVGLGQSDVQRRQVLRANHRALRQHFPGRHQHARSALGMAIPVREWGGRPDLPLPSHAVQEQSSDPDDPHNPSSCGHACSHSSPYLDRQQNCCVLVLWLTVINVMSGGCRNSAVLHAEFLGCSGNGFLRRPVAGAQSGALTLILHGLLTLGVMQQEHWCTARAARALVYFSCSRSTSVLLVQQEHECTSRTARARGVLLVQQEHWCTSRTARSRDVLLVQQEHWCTSVLLNVFAPLTGTVNVPATLMTLHREGDV